MKLTIIKFSILSMNAVEGLISEFPKTIYGLHIPS